MSYEYSFGSEKVNPYKFKFIIFLLIVYLIGFFFMIPANQVETSVIVKFLVLGIIFFIPYLMDLFFIKKELPLDTVVFEKNSPFPILNNHKTNLIISLIIGFLTFLWVRTTGLALIQQPTFHIGEGFFAFSKGINAFLSGLLPGVFESLVFFAFLFPTIHALINKYSKSFFISFLIAAIISSLLFMSFHFWVYGYNQQALLSTLLFGFENVLLIYLFRSVYPCITIHFFHNLAVALFSILGFSFGII